MQITVSYNGSLQATQGTVAFPLGTARRVGNSWDGSAYVVIPDGGSINVSEPTPIAYTETSSVRNGSQKNPLMQIAQLHADGSSATVMHGFDQRASASWDATKRQTSWPVNLVAGDVLVKVVSRPAAQVSNAREGLIDEWAVLHVINETAYAAMGSAPSGYIAPAPFGWSGRTNANKLLVDHATTQDGWRLANESAVLALRPSLSTVGMTVNPNLSTTITRISRFNIGLHCTTSPSALEELCIYRYGGDAASNYGGHVSNTFSTLAMHFLGTASNADVQAWLRYLIPMGSWWNDQSAGRVAADALHTLRGDAGYFEYFFIPMCLGLVATGRSARKSNIATTAPGNQMSSGFLWDATLLGERTPRTLVADATFLGTYYERTVSGVSGNDVTFNFPRNVSNGPIPNHNNYNGMEVWEGSTFRALVNDADDVSVDAGTNPNRTVTFTTATGIAVSDLIHFREPYPTYEGDPDWTLNSMVDNVSYGRNLFMGSVAAPYRAQQQWASSVMIERALGLYHSSMDPMERMVLEATYGPHGFPDHWGYYPASGNDDMGSPVWVEQMWNAHIATLGIDTAAPVISSFTITPTGANTADISFSTTKGSGRWSLVVTTSASPPSLAQIEMGKDDTGAYVTSGKFQTATVSASGTQTGGITGLTSGPTYYAHLVHRTVMRKRPAAASTSASFTT